MMTIEFTQQALSALTASLNDPNMIALFAAIFALGLLLASIGIFALGLGLGLALSHRHLQQEVTSFKQGKSCATSNDAVMDSVTRERDSWHAQAMTLKRIADLEARVDVLQAQKSSRTNSACRACQLSTHAGASDSISRDQAVIRPMPPSATPQPVAQLVTAAKLTQSFVDTPTDKSNTTPTDTTTPTVAIATPVVNTTPQPIHGTCR
ncbi:hypothetical protein HDU80_010375 [Chytriomyces hyalinus]|nr:hypothetical protein HDU80_010375 [Chytriomyces hyalinus]